MSKNYFNYLVKSKWHSILFVALMFALNLAVTFMLEVNLRFRYLESSSTLLSLALAYALPPVLFKYVDKKCSADAYFTLPIARNKVARANLVFGSLLLVVPHIFNQMVLLLIDKNYSIFGPLFVGIVAYIALMTFNSFTFLVANSVFDGIVMEFAYTFIPFLAYILVNSIITRFIYGLSSIDGEIFARMSLPMMTIGRLMELNGPEYNIRLLLCAIVYLILGLVGVYFQYTKRKIERAENLSGEKLSYPLIINLYVIVLMLSVSFGLNINDVGLWIWYFLLFMAYIVANFVYKRKIQITVKNIAVVALSILLSLGISFAADKTSGFGLSYMYNHNPELIHYSYSASDDNLLDEINQREGGKAVYCDVSFEIDLTKEEYRNNKELVDIFNGYRDATIKNHFETGEGRYYFEYGNLFEVIENPEYNPETKKIDYFTGTQYQYYGHGFTVEELKKIAQYTPVLIKYATSDSDEWGTLNLLDYLNE